MAEWQAYQDSVNAAQRPAVPADSAALSVAAENAGDASATVTIAASASVETKTRLESLVGPSLAAAAEAQPEEFTIENDVMAVRFRRAAVGSSA